MQAALFMCELGDTSNKTLGESETENEKTTKTDPRTAYPVFGLLFCPLFVRQTMLALASGEPITKEGEQH